MMRDTLVELIEPMSSSARADPLALCTSTPANALDDTLPCHENPRPEGEEHSLTENVNSPLQAEPAQMENLIKQISEVNEQIPAFDGLMIKFEMAVNSNFEFGFLDKVEADTFGVR
jgi:hypothetical protein